MVEVKGLYLKEQPLTLPTGTKAYLDTYPTLIEENF